MIIEYLQLYFTAFIMLFLIFDAVGNVPIFYTLTEGLEENVRRKTIQNSVVIAGLMLFIFAFGGKHLLGFFHISLDDFRVAGGVILLIVSIEGLLGRVEAMKLKAEQLAVVPLATPLLAGPGSISVVIYLMEGGYGAAPTVVSIIANVVIAWIVLTNSHKVLKILGRNGSLIIARIISFILAALAVAMIREGIINMMRSLK
ncbi:MAG: MarC family protein [Candidatus Methanomethyliaceae archaeon]|nr:MarC family protein [Candidatus Methanomethyliaceae archaeon]MDW7970532.1 MarC family protein [Nitrososphaerota archaeon]